MNPRSLAMRVCSTNPGELLIGLFSPSQAVETIQPQSVGKS